MPKINIIEKDLTSSGNPLYDDFVVAIPCVCSASGLEPVLIRPSDKLFSESESSGEKEKGVLDNYDPDTSTKNFSYIEYLHDSGNVILFVPISSADDLEGVYSDTHEHAIFSKLEDRGLYDIRFIVLGQYSNANTSYNAIRCAAVRGDAVAIIDIESPEGVDPATAYDINYYMNKTLGEGKEAFINKHYVDGDDVKESIFKYGAAFSPEFECSQFGDEKVLASIGYIAAFSDHINRFPEWFATAGSIRGVMPFSNVTPSINYGNIDVNKYLTTRDGQERSCNPICLVRPYGNIIYGNRTLYRNSDEGDSGEDLKASHFLNIRQLCCTLKKVIYRAARKFTFEPNSDVLWVNFCEEIRPTLEKMRTSQGIRGYSIVKQPTSKKALLKAKIIISPIEAVEDFDFTVELADEVVVTE